MTANTAGRRSGHGASSAGEEIAEDMNAAAEQLRGARASHTVLVVDDHPAMLYATARLLRHAGFNILEASAGSDAIDRAEVLSAIVLDVNLPDVNGVAVLQEIRRISARHIPIILTSAVYTDELHRTVALDAGADAYLVAPLDHDTLILQLDRLLG